MLKAVERGEHPVEDTSGKIAASLKTGRTKIGIVMDDRIVTMEMDWATIKATSELALSEFILKSMMDQQNNS